ncbi:hypothetical protein JE959_001588 [Aeromonas veronii]|nr:hypothetical protein [Aeromonas veronii]
MSTERFFDYYQLSGRVVKELGNSYRPIEERRLAIFDELNRATGAVSALVASNVFEKGEFIRDLVFHKSHAFPVPVKLKKAGRYMDADVFTAKPADKSEDGKKYFDSLNEKIQQANNDLHSAPTYSHYLLDHFNLWFLGCCGPAEAGRNGERLGSSRAGYDKSGASLLFAIPNQMMDGQQPPCPTSEFKKITYGQFYDLTNNVG